MLYISKGRVILSYAGDFGAGVFDFVWGDRFEDCGDFLTRHGYEGGVVAEGDVTDFRAFESAFGDEEPDDVASRDFFFLADVEVDSRGPGTNGVGGLSFRIVVAVGGYIIRYIFAFGGDDVDVAFGILASGAAVAMGPCFGRGREVVVDYGGELGDVEAARSEVGGDEDRCGAVGEHYDGVFTVVLFEATVIESGGEGGFA